MSYEGYSQLLCKNGHSWNLDSYQMDYLNLKDHKCPKCGCPAIWENGVNVTNGSWDDNGNRIDGFVNLKIKQKISGICSNCGEEHICETIYEIPKKKK